MVILNLQLSICVDWESMSEWKYQNLIIHISIVVVECTENYYIVNTKN